MSLGFDLGSSRFRSVREDRRRLLARQAAAAYCTGPNSPELQRQLDGLGVTWATCDDNIVLMGDAAVRWAPAIQAPLKRVLPHGRIVAGDPVVRQILQVIFEMVLPTPRRPAEVCCLTLPAAAAEHTVETEYFARIVERAGYQPVFISQSHAMGLSELGKSQLTGCAITFGAAGCEASILRHGREVWHGAVARGVDWVDEETARHTAQYIRDRDGQRLLDVGMAAQQRARMSSLVRPMNYHEELASRLHAEWLQFACRELGQTMRNECSSRMLDASLPVVCGGGPTAAAGFSSILMDSMKHSDFPLAANPLACSIDAGFAVARGCLIHAELDAIAMRRPEAAAA